jgi:putative serine protease PepD
MTPSPFDSQPPTGGSARALWPSSPPVSGQVAPPPPPPGSPSPAGGTTAGRAGGNPSPAGRPAKPNGRAGLVALAAVTGLLAGGLGGFLGAQAGDSGDASATPTTRTASPISVQVPSSEPVTPIGEPSLGIDVKAVLAAVEPAVVQVVSGEGDFGTGTGTGFIVSDDGQILTNAHVVAGATDVRVRLSGQSTARPATVIGVDDDGDDVALLQLDDLAGLPEPLPVAPLGSGTASEVGDSVVAVGYALGLRGTPTVTAGIVSAKDRSVDLLNGLIQHDASISPGNSGGPLVNAAGEVIGINTASFDVRGGEGENIGFAIPIDDAVAIAERLTGTPVEQQNGFLGVSTNPPGVGDLGAVIREVTSGSAADDAGLQPGDVITAVDGTVVPDPGALGRAIRQAGEGATVTLTIERSGEAQDVEVVLGVLD